MPAPSRAAIGETHAMTPHLVVMLVSMLLGSQAIATDLYLPALPSLTEAFGAGVAQAQLTLTGMLLAFGLSQLAWGPLSDRFGRRPILLAGLSLFTLASAGCALAGSMQALVGWRILQGAALGAGVMVARAMVRDVFQPVEGAHMMSKAMTGLGAIACLTGPVGGLLVDLAGWRALLGLVSAFGALILAVVAWRFEETLGPASRAPLHPAAIARSWGAILRHRGFQANAALSTATFAALLTFLAASPFVLMKVLGLSRLQFGLCMFSMSSLYIAGTFLCRRLLARLGLRRTVAIGGALALTGGTAIGVLALAGVQGLWAILGPFWLIALSHGINQPCGQSGSVAPFPQSAGAASALNGFLMTCAAFVTGGWIGAHLDGTVFALTNTLWFWTAVVAAVAWTGMQRHGEARHA
ncbi:multidrug effflux MFS transporter [Ramlibacter sp. MAHUQ-53]|uniref:multidrug effflux MFS transporter n=1 Tax=unclassified Ramlibacter TaxID=2617605 RepID=UPI003626290C